MRTLCGTILAAVALPMVAEAAETNTCIAPVERKGVVTASLQSEIGVENGVKYFGEGRNEQLDVYRSLPHELKVAAFERRGVSVGLGGEFPWQKGSDPGQSLLIQVRQAKLGRTNSGRSYVVKKSTYD